MLYMKKHIPTLCSSLLISLFFLPFILSCEKEITIDLPSAENKIVVEGYIENGEHPYVMLSKTAPYFAPLDSSSLQQYGVKGALVTVSDGVTADTLKEIIPGFFYQAFNMKGEAGKTYTLRVESGEQSLTAQTLIPALLPLDSVWFSTEGKKDSLGYLWCLITDPPSYGNCYKYMVKRLNKDKDFLASFGSVFEDKFINGKNFKFYIERGWERGGNAESEAPGEWGYFKKGDTIVLKWSTIDQATFDFWRLAEVESNSNGNPFASPTTIKTNISGGIGIWGGYGTVYDTVIAK